MVSTVADSIADSKANPSLKQQAAQIAQQMSQDCVARRLRQVTRTVTRLYDEALRPHGLTVNQLNILAVIISQQQIRPGQLGQSLGMEKSTVSRTIDRMVSKGWLKVAPGQDSRTQLLSVTPKGNKLLLAVTPIWDDLQAGILTSGGHSILHMLTLSDADDASTGETAPPYTPLTSPEPAYAHEPISAEDFYL